MGFAVVILAGVVFFLVGVIVALVSSVVIAGLVVLLGIAVQNIRGFETFEIKICCLILLIIE